MKSNKKTLMICILIILFLSSVRSVYPLGVSPSKKIIDFSPSLKEQVTLTLHNKEKKEFKADVMLRGDLSEYVKLSGSSIYFSADDLSKEFTYEVILPDHIDQPGMHNSEIIFKEVPLKKEGEEIFVEAQVAVVSELNVMAPYPGKYVEASLDIVSANVGEEVKFFLKVSNLGELDISKVKALFYIYDNENDLVTVVDTDEKQLKSTQRKEFVGRWDADVTMGHYRVKAVLDYDGMILNLDSSFMVGDFFLKLLDVSVDNFNLGDIAKFNVLVENLAGEDVKSMSAEITLFDQDNNKVADLKSVPEDISKISRKGLLLFWDTQNVEEGTYDGKIILRYGDKISEDYLKVHVFKDAIEVEIIGFTKITDSSDKTKLINFSKDQYILLSVLFLLVVGIILLILLKKFKKKPIHNRKIFK